MPHFIKAGLWSKKRLGNKGELDLDNLISSVAGGGSGGGSPAILVESGAEAKVSAMSAATNLTGAVIPIVQGGVNKKADAGLFGGWSTSVNTELTAEIRIENTSETEGITFAVDSESVIPKNIYLNPLYSGIQIGQNYLDISLNAVDISSENETDSSQVYVSPAEITIDTLALLLPNLPTSASGLAVNQVWNDNGTLKIVLP